MDLVDLAGNALDFCDELADVVAWCSDPAALRAVLALVDHPKSAVRRSVAQALPRLTAPPRPAPVVRALIRLSGDPVAEVRDCACHALGTRLADVDTPQLRRALLARLADPHRDTSGEALLGLARRHDPRVLPVLRTRLAGDDAWLPEVTAAGAIGDPSLHVLIRARLAGWHAEVVPKVCAALRLTDPDGVGDDLVDGLAEWYRKPPTRRVGDRYWWSVTLNLLEQAEYRAVEITGAVWARLADDPAAGARLASSTLGRTATAYGWTPG